MGYYDDPFDSFQYYDTPDDSAGGPAQNPFDQALRYYQAQRQPVEAEAFFSPDNPAYQAYRRRSSEAPESEGILRSYLSSMPTHDQYEPGVGRKIAGFLLGTLSGLNNPALAGVNAKKFIDDPYEDALQDWKNQGSNINLQARLADSARTRDIASLKEGMLNEFKAKRAADISNRGGIRQEGTNARNFVSADQGERRLTDAEERDRQRKADSEWLHAFRQQQQDFTELLKNAQLGLQQDKFDHQVNDPRTSTRPSAHDVKANDPSEILKQRQASEDLALNDAKQVPMFKPILDAMRAADIAGQDPWKAFDSLQIDPQIRSNFKDFIKSRVGKYGVK